MAKQTPLTDTTPTTRAWKEGRRIYIRCGYNSRLNGDLRAIGAKWDPDALSPAATHTDRPGALWVGSGKAEQVIALIEAADERAAAAEQVKADATESGRWVTIPFEADQVRAQAKRIGARWDPARKQWAMPTDEALAAVDTAITKWREDVAAALAKAEARAVAREQRAAVLASETMEARVARLLAASGRTATGEEAEVRHVSTRRFNRRTAEASGHQVGAIIRLADGRHGMVVKVDVWFTDDTMASSTCWHPETHDEAHWDWRYKLMIVEPTADETAEAARRAAAAQELTDLDGLFTAMTKAPRTENGEQERWTQVSGPRISRFGGTTAYSDGHVVLDGDRLVYQHPGYYDDYRLSERASSDTELVAAFQRITEAGPRNVGCYRIGDGR